MPTSAWGKGSGIFGDQWKRLGSVSRAWATEARIVDDDDEEEEDEE